MGESAFNLAIWQERLVDESWGSDPCGGPGGRVYTWPYDVNRLGNPVIYKQT